MITRPADVATAAALPGPYRAGGVDLLRTGAPPPSVDLAGLTELRAITPTPGGLRVGALTTLADLAANTLVRGHYPALAEAAATVATPLVRTTATVGGNLLQAAHCSCTGPDCPYRTVYRDRAVCFDTDPCAAPHPSTLAAVLTCFDAVAQFAGGREAGIPGLTAGGLLTAVQLPTPWPGERSRYLRLTPRAATGWPLVEAVVRVAGEVDRIRVVAGAVAPRPRRLTAVEDHLLGHRPTPPTCQEAAAKAGEGANPVPGAAYKLTALTALIDDALPAELKRPAR